LASPDWVLLAKGRLGSYCGTLESDPEPRIDERCLTVITGSDGVGRIRHESNHCSRGLTLLRQPRIRLAEFARDGRRLTNIDHCGGHMA
jgi:hypothetical protein